MGSGYRDGAVYARKHEFSDGRLVVQRGARQSAAVCVETHYDVRAIFALMSARYALEGKRAEADRYARLAEPQLSSE